jgi:hypothetical protein
VKEDSHRHDGEGIDEASREILRLKYEQHLAHRAIARACGVGLGTVSEYVRRARQAGLTWPVPAEWDDAHLEARLFQRVGEVVGVPRPLPDMAWVHQELKRPGVTLQRLHREYLEQQDFTRFAYITGMRKGEIASLRWDDVDREVAAVQLKAENQDRRGSHADARG